MNEGGISFVVPVKDEADNVAALHEEIAAVMRETGGEWELIFVDDGSEDDTFARLRGLHARDPRVRALRFERNFGKSAALTAGFEEARGGIVFTLDGDLQDDPREVPAFLAALDRGFDLVSGWKRRRRDPLGKRVASRLFNLATRLVTGLQLHDINCGFKAYRAEITRGLRLRHGLHRFIPFLARARGYRIGEIEVAHRPRLRGQSKYGWERVPQALVDVHLAWLVARGRDRPLRALLPAGAGLLALGILVLGAGAATASAWRWPALIAGAAASLAGANLAVMALLTSRALAREPQGAAYTIAERLG